MSKKTEQAVVKAAMDSARLDWLEKMADKDGGILLHNGCESGRLGLGMRKTNRTLRQSIDDAMRTEITIAAHAKSEAKKGKGK